MSKRRTRQRSVSSLLSCTSDEAAPSESKMNVGSITARSFYVPKKSQDQVVSRTIDLTEMKKEKLFNRNISFFRDHFNQNDPSLLPFMSSLRQNKSYDSLQRGKNNKKERKTTQVHPFNVSFKRTSNQQISKQIFDPVARQTRVSTAYYRWHNKSGRGTNNCVKFQCSLRDYSNGKDNSQEKLFFNTVKPIKYVDVQLKAFDENQIICPRQRRLFRFKGGNE